MSTKANTFAALVGWLAWETLLPNALKSSQSETRKPHAMTPNQLTQIAKGTEIIAAAVMLTIDEVLEALEEYGIISSAEALKITSILAN